MNPYLITFIICGVAIFGVVCTWFFIWMTRDYDEEERNHDFTEPYNKIPQQDTDEIMRGIEGQNTTPPVKIVISNDTHH